jgi:hypothetical protein
MDYVKISADKYAALTTSYSSVTVTGSGGSWDVKLGADVVSNHADQSTAQGAAEVFVVKLGRIVVP